MDAYMLWNRIKSIESTSFIFLLQKKILRCLLEFPRLCLSSYLPPDISTEHLILSASKYSRYIFRGEFQIFCPIIIAQIFEEKNICYFISPISLWRGPQWKSLFWAFLLNSLWSPSTQKISFHWAPLLAFSNVWLNIFKFCFLNICCNFFGKKSGS